MTPEELRRWLYDFDATERMYVQQKTAADINDAHSMYPSDIKYDENSLSQGIGPLFRTPEETISLCRNPRFAPGDYHAHQFVEIVYVYHGHCTNMVEGVMLTMRTGDFCFISPDVYHVITKNESTVINILVRRERFMALCSDPRLGVNPVSQFASDLTARTNRYKYLLAQNADQPEIRDMIEQMISEYVENSEFGTLMLETLFLQVISRLLERKPVFSFAKGEFCSKELLMVGILRFIRDNYRTVDLRSLAAHFRYTPTHVCRLLKRYTGLSFVRILTQIRMEKSVEMLLETDLPVQEIALRNGYESIEHFHRMFKEYYHQTPRQYRQRNAPGEKTQGGAP